MSHETAWRWMTKGLNGVTGMVLKHHEDADSGACPDEWLECLEQNAAIIARIVGEQREKRRGEVPQPAAGRGPHG